MRLVPSFALLLSALSFASAQSHEGTYRPEGVSPIPWRINEHHTLIWNGSPYLPVGLRTGGSPAEIEAARAQGVRDLVLELPAGGMGWSEAIAAAEAAKLRYVVAISSLAPMAQGITVEPQTYRIVGITAEKTLTLPLPGATSALVVMASRRDSAVQSATRVKVENGKLTYVAKPRNQLEHVVLVYPEVASIEHPDYWEGLDAHRDILLRTLRQKKPGPGLRGILNPLGTLVSFGSGTDFVPTSPYFRNELRIHMEAKYRNLEAAQRTWAVRSSDIATWEELTRLVPLWSGSRGVGHLWDPATDRVYMVNQRNSQAWADIQEVMAQAAARRYQRLVRAIRSVTDVPVVQEWQGWAGPYAQLERAADGVSAHIVGTSPLAIADAASRVTSTALRQTGGNSWLIAGDIDLGGGANPDSDLRHVLDDLTALGMRGWFIDARTSKASKAYAEEARTRGADASLAELSPQALYFPENAMNPAVPQRLPGGVWWLPSPLDGNRLDLGEHFYAYRYRDGAASYTAIWAKGAGRVKLRMADPKVAGFRSVDGSDSKPKLVKGGVEVFLNEYPLLISGTEEIPIPEPALAETVLRFDALVKLAEKLVKDTAEDRFLFRDSLASFERNPGGAFALLRQHYLRLNARLSRFTWIEAESSREHNFSESLTLPGTSAGGVLALRSLLPLSGAGYVAEYNVNVKTEETQHVWLAARVPFDKRGDVQLVVGGQVLRIEGEPVSYYSSGFAWYRLGTTVLKGPQQKIRLEVGGESAELAIDSIVFSPDPFVPSGVRQPETVASGG